MKSWKILIAYTILTLCMLLGCKQKQEEPPQKPEPEKCDISNREFDVFRDYSYKVLSPDKRRVAFMSIKDVRNGNPKLYVRDLETEEVTQLTKGPQIDSYPIWSPDGKSLAFISTRDAFYEIYKIDLDTKNIKRLTYNFGGKIKPASLQWNSWWNSIKYQLWEKDRWVEKTAPVSIDFSKLDFDTDGILNRRDKDIDGDKIPNEEDNAPWVANIDQLDDDNDGKGHVIDNNIHLRSATYDPLTEEPNYPLDLITMNETGYYFIQLEPDFDYRELDRFMESISSISDNLGDAYFIKSHLSKEQIEAIPEIRAAGIYQPAERTWLSDSMNGKRRLKFFAESGDCDARVYVFQNRGEVKEAIKNLGGEIIGGETFEKMNLEYLWHVKIDCSKIKDMLFIPDVFEIDPKPVYMVRPPEP